MFVLEGALRRGKGSLWGRRLLGPISYKRLDSRNVLCFSPNIYSPHFVKKKKKKLTTSSIQRLGDD